MALIFDIETNGFLKDMTTVHCIVTKDTETKQVVSYRAGYPYELEEGLGDLDSGQVIVGHNIIGFDIPALQKIYKGFNPNQDKVLDTLVLSRLIYSDLREKDGLNVASGLLPAKLWGSHSLKAWGYRLGILKGDLGTETDRFDVLTQEMLEYCERDVEVTEALYNHLINIKYSPEAIDIEHKVAWICSQMERNGWPFDVQGAVQLYSELVQKRAEILKNMQDTFEPIVEERISEKTGKRLKDKVTEFNPASRDQIAKRLATKYGWKPTVFTPGGKPQVDEDILKALPYPEAQVLAEYFLLNKRIGQIAEGDQAWLKLERNGKIHGSINTNGAVTGRATHNSPNMAQVPSVQSIYGKECRELFTVRDGFSLVGVDLSGLELRCLAHFMAKWDNGDYGRVVTEGKQEDGTDIHTVNQKAAGLSTRAQAKTFIYGFLYGAGDAKVGTIVGKGAKEGKKLKETFLNSLPALKNLRAQVIGTVEGVWQKDRMGNKAVCIKEGRPYLVGLDKRRLTVRSSHAALNTLLQSAGAVIAKQWLIEVIKECDSRGYKNDVDYCMLGFIHDETQWEVRKDLAEEFGKMVVECAARAGEYFKFNIKIGAEYNIGRNWYETH